MTVELFLPPPVMENILSFMDTTDYAHMAQTCTTWQRIIYRKSIWVKHCITYKSFPDLILDIPPHGARHIGITRRSCFFHWLEKVYHFRMDMFPLSLERRIDANDFINIVYRYWKRLDRPCLIKEHHLIHDLLRLPFPETLSKSDQKRILYRILSHQISSTKNAYANYIELQRNYLNPILVIPHVVSDDETSSDPLHRYRFSVLSVQRKRLEKINSMVRAAFDIYDYCSNAVMRRGMTEFELNDIWYKSNHDTLWGKAGFTFNIKKT
jgi:hypothetical protein